MGLGKAGFTLGSLRPGKATDLFLQGKSPDTIKFMAGWKSDSAFSVYIQEAMSMLVWSKVDSRLEATLQAKIVAEKQAVEKQASSWEEEVAYGAKFLENLRSLITEE